MVTPWGPRKIPRRPRRPPSASAQNTPESHGRRPWQRQLDLLSEVGDGDFSPKKTIGKSWEKAHETIGNHGKIMGKIEKAQDFFLETRGFFVIHT